MSVSPAYARTPAKSDRLVVRLSLASAAILAVVAVASQLQVAELRRQVAALSFDAAVPVPTPTATSAAIAPRKPAGLIAVSAPTGPTQVAAPAQAAPPRAPLTVDKLARLRPTGVDACARMESADAAVLGTLR